MAFDPIGILIGYYIVKAEPAVQVLNEQVEDLTGGTVSRGMMNAALSIGVACAVALAMVRVLTGISIYWILIPGYTLALVLCRLSAGLHRQSPLTPAAWASGPMTSTFLLPLAMGACTAIGGNVVSDAFGLSLWWPWPVDRHSNYGACLCHKSKTVPQPSAQLSDDIVIELEEE